MGVSQIGFPTARERVPQMELAKLAQIGDLKAMPLELQDPLMFMLKKSAAVRRGSGKTGKEPLAAPAPVEPIVTWPQQRTARNSP